MDDDFEKMANKNPNADVLAMGGSIATAGIGAQVLIVGGIAIVGYELLRD